MPALPGRTSDEIMPLCKPKTKTPALLAACRANARKGTGPRTPEGKCRSRLNALKHGRYSPNLRESLVQAGRDDGRSAVRLHSHPPDEVPASRNPGAEARDGQVGAAGLVLGGEEGGNWKETEIFHRFSELSRGGPPVRSIADSR